jgi:Glucose-6-phosphate dehydrogenase, C-terminal domain
VFGGSELVDRRLSRGGQPEPPVHGDDQAIPGQPEEVAARLWVDTDRCSGVSFLLRTGKQLAASRQVVSLVLRQPDASVPALPAVGDVLAFDLDGDGELDLCSSSTNQTGPDGQHGARRASAEDSGGRESAAADTRATTTEV